MKNLLIRSFSILFALSSLYTYTNDRAEISSSIDSSNAAGDSVLSEGKRLCRALMEVFNHPVNRGAVEVLLANPLLDASISDYEGKTALHIIANHDKSTAAWLNILLNLPQDRRPDINKCNISGETALMRAVRNANPGFIPPLVSPLLQEPGIDASLVNKEGDSILHIMAVCSSYKFIPQVLALPLNKRPALNAKNVYGQTALLLALEYCPAAAKMLLDQPDIDASCCNRDGDNAAHIAAWLGRDWELECMLALPKNCRPNINRKNNDGAHPLFLAMFSPSSTTAHILLSQPRLRLTKRDKELVLQGAAARGFVDVLEKIWSGPKTKRPNINAQCEKKRTALLYALIENQFPAALWLLNKSAIDASAIDSDGFNAWHYIAYHGKSYNRPFSDEQSGCPCCGPLTNSVSTTMYTKQMVVEIIQKMRQLPAVRQPDIGYIQGAKQPFTPIELALRLGHTAIAEALRV